MVPSKIFPITMKLLLFSLSFILMTLSAFGQINLADSTVQVIGYWDKNEKQTYKVATEKFKLKGLDTISREVTHYEIDVTILDSTAKSYTMEYFYKNYQIKTDNEFSKKLASIAQDIKVIAKTNEMGVFEEVLNWKEVRDYTKKGFDLLRKDYKQVKGMEQILNNVEKSFSTKEAIEATSINDIHQMHFFHGVKYLLGEELEGKLKVPNILVGEDFEADMSIYLDEINADDNNYIMRASQYVDEEQLIEATIKYLQKMSPKKGGINIKREDIKDLKHEVLTSSRIHNSGWVIYSIQTKTVSSDDITNIEERIIEIQ